MKTVQLKDKTFGISIPESEILGAVKTVADKINNDLKGRDPLFLVVLNGAFMFASDLMKMIDLPSQLSFVKFSSYEGTQSSGKMRELIGLNDDISGRTVVVVEDIVDSGYTMSLMINDLKKRNVFDLRIATLLSKPDALKYPVKLDYIALEIPNDFIVGYGLDYDGYGRNLKDIYTLIPEK